MAGVELTSPLEAGAFYTEVERALEQGGWPRVRLPHPSFEPRLFQATDLPPPETGLYGTPFFQQRGLTLLLPLPTDGPGGSSRVQLNIRRGGVPLEFLPPSNINTGLLYDLFPRLTAPTGAELSMGFEAAGRDMVSGSATVTTDLSPTEAEHFAAQLAAAGWRVAEQRAEKRSTVVRLEYRDDEKTYDARLSVAHPEGQAYSEVALEAALRTDN